MYFGETKIEFFDINYCLRHKILFPFYFLGLIISIVFILFLFGKNKNETSKFRFIPAFIIKAYKEYHLKNEIPENRIVYLDKNEIEKLNH